MSAPTANPPAPCPASSAAPPLRAALTQSSAIARTDAADPRKASLPSPGSSVDETDAFPDRVLPLGFSISSTAGSPVRPTDARRVMSTGARVGMTCACRKPTATITDTPSPPLPVPRHGQPVSASNKHGGSSMPVPLPLAPQPASACRAGTWWWHGPEGYRAAAGTSDSHLVADVIPVVREHRRAGERCGPRKGGHHRKQDHTRRSLPTPSADQAWSAMSCREGRTSDVHTDLA